MKSGNYLINFKKIKGFNIISILRKENNLLYGFSKKIRTSNT